MLIKKIAFGNKSEAFIEDRLTDGVNIIFSDDNNRGKTLVIQGLMYSLGYESIFPSSFQYKDIYFYSEIEVDSTKYEFLRKKNSIIVKSNNSIQMFNSISEMKYFMDEVVFTVPKIQKDNRSSYVDLSLLYELFFIGQDNRNPSGLISKGQFNKSDFKNMVYDLADLSTDILNTSELKNIKNRLNELKINLKGIRKKILLINQNPEIAKVASKTYESEEYQNKINAINDINQEISKLKRSRTREANRKSKLEYLISELNSLNTKLSEGDVKCGECGSDKIYYSNDDITFEVSNIDVRNEILKSISKNIIQKNELIYDLTRELELKQDSLNRELEEAPPNFQEIVLYQDQIVSDRNYDNEASSILKEIDNLKSQLSSSQNIDETLKEKRKDFDNNLSNQMNELYRNIDPNGNLRFKDIFTIKGSTFSGSEGQEFYFCKVIALSYALNHDFPIIVDSFRDGELSTNKEDRMLNLYSTLDRQIILTSTLKNEEYNSNKYGNRNNVTTLDYSSHQDCKILKEENQDDFSKLLTSFKGVVI